MSSVPGDGTWCTAASRLPSCNRIGRITRGGAPHWMMLRLLRMGLRVKLLAMGVVGGSRRLAREASARIVLLVSCADDSPS